ncbi:MAG: DegV family protein [Clostridia bacterium]|nr:DegV family protein [Clostridia bacterium]
MKYTITADSTCDLPQGYVPEDELPIIPLSYTLDGKTYSGRDGDSLPPEEFYAKMRAGAMPQTALVNVAEAEHFFDGVVSSGSDVLHLCFSSALSGTFNSTRVAAQAINEKYGRTCVTVVDTLCASLGDGLLIHYAFEQKRAGKSLEETRDWLEQNKLHLCHNFTVSDLFHLHRGGRVSMTAAIVGTMLGIKPVLHVDNEGRLIPIRKVRGRPQSLTALVDNMERQVGNFDNKVVFISHGDCLADAEYVAKLVQERFSPVEIIMNFIGPVIGTHSGPDTVALFFMGETR